MDALEAFAQHFEKDMVGYGGSTVGIMPEGSAKDPAVANNAKIQRISKGDLEEAEQTARDQGIDVDSAEGEEYVQQLLEGIQRIKAEQQVQKALMLDKAEGKPYIDPDRGSEKYAGNRPKEAGWAWKKIKELLGGEYQGDVRAARGKDYQPSDSEKNTRTAVYRLYQRLFDYALSGFKGKEPALQLMQLEKASMSPALANLLSAAAGWALSADVASQEIPPHLIQEWERTLSRKDKEKLQEEIARKLRRAVKNGEESDFLDDLGLLYKDHAPIPPRQGLMFDPVKHRWTRPEKIGRTVWEVQGHKRFRGTGTGAHERGRSGKGVGGYGVGSAEAGRRFRSTGDVGRERPHEVKHPSQRELLSLKRRRKTQRRRKHAKKT